jgi:YVTN family beta-propeller protein
VNIFDVTDENGEYSLSKIPANLNILLSVSDGGNLLASKTVFILPDNTLTEDIIINSSGSTPVPSPSSSGHPVHNSILTTFSVGNSPKGIVISKDGMKGYVATEMGTYIFSTVTNQVENIIKTGAGSKKICLYDNRAYVTNNSTDDIKISCLNTVDNSIIDTFLMPKYPFDINVSPDGKKLYVANEDQTLSSVYVIDTGTKSISTIPVSKIPHGLEISPDGKRLYTTSMVTDTTPVDIVSVIDTETSSVIKTISVGAVPYEIALSPDGKKAYVSNSGGIGDGKEGISVIDTTTNSLVTTINLIGTPLSLRVSPDGSRLFVTHFDEQVTIIDTSSNNIITTLSLSKTVGEDIIFSPDGLKAYITTSGGGGIVNIIY